MHANEMRSKLMTPEKRQFQMLIEKMLEVAEDRRWILFYGKLLPETEGLLAKNGYNFSKKIDGIFTEYTISW